MFPDIRCKKIPGRAEYLILGNSGIANMNLMDEVRKTLKPSPV